MKLSNIVLKRVGLTRFSQLYQEWHYSTVKYTRQQLFEITEPITASDFADTISSVRELPYFSSVAIHFDGKWNQYTRSKLARESIPSVAAIADQHVGRRGLLVNLKYKKRLTGTSKKPPGTGTIAFTKRDNSVVSYLINLPSAWMDLCSYAGDFDRCTSRVRGIWQPR